MLVSVVYGADEVGSYRVFGVNFLRCHIWHLLDVVRHVYHEGCFAMW